MFSHCKIWLWKESFTLKSWRCTCFLKLVIHLALLTLLWLKILSFLTFQISQVATRKISMKKGLLLCYALAEASFLWTSNPSIQCICKADQQLFAKGQSDGWYPLLPPDYTWCMYTHHLDESAFFLTYFLYSIYQQTSASKKTLFLVYILISRAMKKLGALAYFWKPEHKISERNIHESPIWKPMCLFDQHYMVL